MAMVESCGRGRAGLGSAGLRQAAARGCCARRGALDQGSTAGLRTEAAPIVGGFGLECSGDQGCGGSAGSGHL